MTIKITLTKLSSKGFSKSYYNLEECFEDLDKYICKSCIITESDVKKMYPDINFEDEDSDTDYSQEYWVNWHDSFPDDWEERNTYWKITRLLGTACGSEFMVELEDEL